MNNEETNIIIKKIRFLRDHSKCEENEKFCGCEKYDEIIDLIKPTEKMPLQHQAIVQRAYNEERPIKFIYAVHHYQGLLDYTETKYFATEKEAREEFRINYIKTKEYVMKNKFEIYQDEDTELYYEGEETCHKILLEAIILPEKTK